MIKLYDSYAMLFKCSKKSSSFNTDINATFGSDVFRISSKLNIWSWSLEVLAPRWANYGVPRGVPFLLLSTIVLRDLNDIIGDIPPNYFGLFKFPRFLFIFSDIFVSRVGILCLSNTAIALTIFYSTTPSSS